MTLHVHTPEGVALSARPEGLRFLNQEATFFYDRISYQSFDGIEEVAALAAAVAPHHHTLILRSHGVAVAGRTLQGAFVRPQYLLLCARSQLLASSASTPPAELPPALCEFTRPQFEAQEARTQLVYEMAALRRLIDRVLPGYAG